MSQLGWVALWTAAGLFLGSIPFSVLLGRCFAQADIREYGDHNPGAFNAGRAAGWRVGLAAVLLDGLKGCVPVGTAGVWCGVSGWGILPVALAPILGHAFSPFLRFRGGKAVAVTFGVWTGLTLGEAPLALGVFLGLFTAVQCSDAWTVVLAMLGLLAHLLLRGAGGPVLAVWVGNLAILAWKQGAGLREPIRPRPWLVRLVSLGGRG